MDADVIVIGSGPGGGSLAQSLARAGHDVLVLERGGYLPRERENWDTAEVFLKNRYQAPEEWRDRDGNTFRPGLHYFVGGNSKVYGAILFRLREDDFGEIAHVDGTSPAWPLSYDDYEPWYQAAEELFAVRGVSGEDPTEPPRAKPYAHGPIAHEPRIQELSDALAREGHRPFHLPVGALLTERDGQSLPDSPCIRCNRFDGFPCLTNGKADAQVMAIDPALRDCPNLRLMTHTYAEKLLTNDAGTAITGVEVLTGKGENVERRTLRAPIFVVACGALSSALLMLRSTNDAHPQGLANGSGQVGRNYMRHLNSIVLAISKTPNPTKFQKTLGINDFYRAPANGGMGDWEFPLGHIQMVGKSDGIQIQNEGPRIARLFPERPFDWMAEHSLDFWLTTEDLPLAENRIRYDGRDVVLDLQDTNEEAHKRLRGKLQEMCGKMGAHPHLFDRELYFGQEVPVGGTAHQSGTLRFGTDPETSVLDTDCKAHQLDNLYVTDASFFPSIGAVNPTLTIIANALRVADVLDRRLKGAAA